MQLNSTTYRLLAHRPRPAAPVQAQAPMAGVAAFQPQGGGAVQDSLEKVLETIRQEALKFMNGGAAKAAPSFTLPGMGQILDELIKSNPNPTPVPTPPPTPKPVPMPKPLPVPKVETEAEKKAKAEAAKKAEAEKKAKAEAAEKAKSPGGTVTVQKGDSLSRIAQRALGDGNRWREIFELNRDQLSDPNKIFPGQVLRLPGGGNKPAPAPAPGPAPSGNAHDRRNNWFISQYGSKWNTNEDVPGYDNGNCGPTSLTMVAKAFGKVSPNAGQADAAIEEARRRMGDGMNERNGTSVAGIARGAKSYGLSANTLWNANSNTIQAELNKGRLVIVHGTVIKDDGRTYGGHYYVVTKIENGKAYLSDPAYPSGPRVISASLLDKSINTRGTRAMISIGP